MRVILSELLTTEYAISTPFDAYLGRTPVRIYAVLDRTAIIQIPGEDQRRVARHDFITVDPDKLRARPSPLIDRLHKSRERGRENSHKHGQNGTEEPVTTTEIEEFHQANGSTYNPLESLAKITTDESGSES